MQALTRMAAPPNSKLTVRIGDKEVELEGDPEHVARVIAHLLALGSAGQVVTVGGVEGGTTPLGGTPASIIDIRTFFGDHSPTSDNEAAAAVAYYYKFVAPQEERKEVIDKTTLDEGFRLANYPLPKRLDATLVHAKDAGYLSQAERGSYRLTTVGHNLVAHSLGPAGKTKPAHSRRPAKSKPKKARKK